MKVKALMVSILIPCSLAATAMAASNDSDFAKKAADGGMAEVTLGQLAADKGSDPRVKEFGQNMVKDHSKANDKLKSVAAKDSITLPADQSAEHKKEADKLSKLSGKDFDQAYTKLMVQDHEEDVAEFKKEAASGSNPDIKAFANDTLPTLQHHLDMIKQIASTQK